jgi:hypothetical protein
VHDVGVILRYAGLPRHCVKQKSVPMTEVPCGDEHFSDSSDYQARFRGVKINLVFTHQGQFKARLSWIELPHLLLVRAKETQSRLAHMSLASDQAAIAFPTRSRPFQMFDGPVLESGNFAFYGPGGHLYQRTLGACNLGLILLPTEYLAVQLKALAGPKVMLPLAGSVLRPSRSATARLRQLHWKACQFAIRKSEAVVAQKVIDALENDILRALVACLTSNSLTVLQRTRRRHKEIIDQFQDILAAHPDRSGARPRHPRRPCPRLRF